MKKIYCYILLPAIILAACNKNETLTATTTGDQFLKAYKNSSDLWSTNEPYASLSKSDKIIVIGGYRQNEDDNNIDEALLMQLTVNDINDLKNTTIKSVDYNIIFGDDVIQDRYIIDTTNENNKIQITFVDESKKIIKGEFSLYLVRDKWFSPNGEKTEFKTGEFYATYSEN